MKKQFTTYEIAKLLKELGFNEPCIAHYISKEGWQLDLTEGSFYFKDKPSKSVDTYSILAPLWQQVIDWFREKHRISISLIPWDYNTWWYQIETFDTVTNELNSVIAETKKIINGMSYYDNREQAILKAIEIIKSNNIIK